MSWAADLEDFVSQTADPSNTCYRKLVAGLWDQGLLGADTPAAIPALIRVLAATGTPEIKRARIALLLGLIAEGHGDDRAETPAATARTALRLGIPHYLELLDGSTAPATRLAATYLLAHFHEDGASILAHRSLQGSVGASARARLERVLQFQDASRGELGDYTKKFVPGGTAPADGAHSQIRASILAPLGAEAQFAIENA